MQRKHDTGLRRLVKAAGYSIQGLKAAWINEAAFRQETVLVMVLAPVACWLGTSMPRRAVLILSLAFILVAELLNSAVESTVDRIGPEHHELSGRAKNLGSAAVLISLVAGFVVWALAAWDRWGP